MADSGDTSAQVARAIRFRELHVADAPLLLANVWSASSARIAVDAGAAAVGTTSFGVALEHGRADGELLPFDVALSVVADIAAAVDVPVTFDLEAGRGETPEDVGVSMSAAIETGVAGVNIEDQRPGTGKLFDVDTQAERLKGARAAAVAAGVPIFINARCDAFFGADVAPDRAVDEVIGRARAYKEAGADGLFVPGLTSLETIGALVAAVELPLNVMVGAGIPALSELAAAGVRRISQGGVGFLAIAGTLRSMTSAYLAGELHPPIEAVGAGFMLLPVLTRPSSG